ncbi:HXXEE domain-containing protein [Subtercola frigoramans]|uniref:HXXEE domain-containing protein n=1 Tax=Subtercola frigoramans TaxID=120298 RepID=A0ABS2L823_9MICO|nr:HXXEE domain-containing protein [Subtercola frigoramans]MBM7473247.1 hypothetical protein [Subtercola frigoramans]
MFTWFDFAWPWIGLGFAAVLAALLATDLLRGDHSLPRWRDLRWLSFLAVVVYLVHNVEEYAIAANGVPHAFPDSLCVLLGQPSFPACGIPPAFFLAVNIPLVWVAGPLAALLSTRFRLAGLTLWGVIGVNAVVHVVPALAQRAYDPGLLTAVIVFMPLTVMVAVATVGRRGPYRRRAGALLFAVGALMHVVLAASAILFLRGLIPEWLLLVAQPAVIAAGYFIVAACDQRLRKSAYVWPGSVTGPAHP